MIDRVLTVGEVVWDIFEDRQVLGGAPLNVAYHLILLGVRAEVITRIGRDALGEQTIKELARLGLPPLGVQRDKTLPTGRVLVSIGDDLEPDYDILAPAAWDAISLEEVAEELLDQDFVLVFGSLAQRDERSRAAVRALQRRAGCCFYDVNLRPPFTSWGIVEDSLGAADLVKVNEAELFELRTGAGIERTDKREIALALMARYNIETMAVTAGSKGAWLLDRGDIFTVPGLAVEVADPVGAGDAFFAALLAGRLKGWDWQRTLELANGRGAYVAGQPGATPAMWVVGL